MPLSQTRLIGSRHDDLVPIDLVTISIRGCTRVRAMKTMEMPRAELGPSSIRTLTQPWEGEFDIEKYPYRIQCVQGSRWEMERGVQWDRSHC